ncbi:MAG: zf-TFIIB domain-containing protein [Chloroflexota bacterium]
MPNSEQEQYLNCPKCQSVMEQVVFGGVTVDRCRACHGIWFDFREEAKLKEMWGSQRIEASKPAAALRVKHNAMPHVSCPRCEGFIEMTRLVVPDQPHIWYEACPSCRGVYFDAGEFADYRLKTPLDTLKSIFARTRD